MPKKGVFLCGAALQNPQPARKLQNSGQKLWQKRMSSAL
jgi:hypothetical protein